LLPLHLEGAALGLNRLLKAAEGLALLLEGQLLARARDAEHHQLALELREISVPPLQQLLCRLASDALLQELVLRDGERRNLGVEGGLQIVGLLGLLLERARPLLSLALLSLRPPEQRMELQVVVADGDHLRLPVGHQGAHPLQVRLRLP
jgi:hypothetical protein